MSTPSTEPRSWPPALVSSPTPGRKSSYGNLIEIDHGYGYVTRYAHASRLLAHVGKRVRRDEVVAEVGCTGTCTAPHVHYEVRRNGRPVDPLNYVLTRAMP